MFGQYETFEPDVWRGSVYVSAEEPSEARFIPIYQQQVSSLYQSTTAQPSPGILPILQSTISSGLSVLGKYLELRSVKEQAEVQKELATLRARQLPQAQVTPSRAGFTLPSNWAIYGIIGMGLLLILRGKPSRSYTARRKVRRVKKQK